jgi:hypothetical protein
MMLAFDHLAVAARDLGEGAAALEAALGVPLDPGGVHPAMGTHNRLLSLGPGEYLEVIAVDPAAPPPGRPRWFGLDRFAGPPRPVAWVARTGDLAAVLAAGPAGAGTPLALSRGDLRWQIAVADDGAPPMGGAFPVPIAWAPGGPHPAARLPDRGVRLSALVLVHPDPRALAAALAPLLSDPRLSIAEGAAPALRATLATPAGPCVLG